MIDPPCVEEPSTEPCDEPRFGPSEQRRDEHANRTHIEVFTRDFEPEQRAPDREHEPEDGRGEFVASIAATENSLAKRGEKHGNERGRCQQAHLLGELNEHRTGGYRAQANRPYRRRCDVAVFVG